MLGISTEKNHYANISAAPRSQGVQGVDDTNASIVSKGIGGNKSSDLLARFDQDVMTENPDVGWLIAGTNDYYSEVTKEIFVNNMRQLIEKIIAIGARPIVFDSSLAPLIYGSDYLLELSKSYATGLAQMDSE